MINLVYTYQLESNLVAPNHSVGAISNPNPINTHKFFALNLLTFELQITLVLTEQETITFEY